MHSDSGSLNWLTVSCYSVASKDFSSGLTFEIRSYTFSTHHEETVMINELVGSCKPWGFTPFYFPKSVHTLSANGFNVEFFFDGKIDGDIQWICVSISVRLSNNA